MAYIFSVFIALVWSFLLYGGSAVASDYWVSASESGVATNNDCGRIAFIQGRPLVHRPFHASPDDGSEIGIADRISSGDELIAPAGSRLEMVAGTNTVLTLGPGARVRVDGLRVFSVDGAEVARLDLTLLSGEIRLQVRRNLNRPEAALIGMGGVEILATRGDVALFTNGGWRCATLKEDAAARLRRGGVAGAPFPVPADAILAGSGPSPLTPEEKSSILSRVPFSFEIATAALPPLPVLASDPEAP